MYAENTGATAADFLHRHFSPARCACRRQAVSYKSRVLYILVCASVQQSPGRIDHIEITKSPNKRGRTMERRIERAKTPQKNTAKR